MYGVITCTTTPPPARNQNSISDGLLTGQKFYEGLVDQQRKTRAYDALRNQYGDAAGDPAAALMLQQYRENEQRRQQRDPQQFVSAPPPASTPPSAAKPNLGVRGATVTRNDAGPSIYLQDPYGAFIYDVVPGGPAAKAGLRQSDIVRTFNGHRVSSFEELNAYAAEAVPGATVQLGVFRDRQMTIIEVGL